jgi:hypothetical protein
MSGPLPKRSQLKVWRVFKMFDPELKEFINAVMPGGYDERPDDSRGAAETGILHGSCHSHGNCTTGARP